MGVEESLGPRGQAAGLGQGHGGQQLRKNTSDIGRGAVTGSKARSPISRGQAGKSTSAGAAALGARPHS